MKNQKSTYRSLLLLSVLSLLLLFLAGCTSGTPPANKTVNKSKDLSALGISSKKSFNNGE